MQLCMYCNHLAIEILTVDGDVFGGASSRGNSAPPTFIFNHQENKQHLVTRNPHSSHIFKARTHVSIIQQSPPFLTLGQLCFPTTPTTREEIFIPQTSQDQIQEPLADIN